MFQVPVADALSRVNPSGRTDIKGLDVYYQWNNPWFESYSGRDHVAGNQRRPNSTNPYAATNGGLARTCETGTKRPQTILEIERWLVCWTLMCPISR